MKLIADAGSTKIDWCVIADDGSLQQYASQGVNALMLSAEEMAQAFPAPPVVPESVYYYGAGCINEAVCSTVASALRSVTGCRGDVEVASDMLGAARAVAGNEPAVVAIIGTGSNTCHYDGRRIISSVPPMGYVVGDYGSGTAIGKRLLAAVYKGMLPDAVRRDLEQWLQLDYADIIRRIYSTPGANRFLASLVPFVAEHRAELSPLAESCFAELFAYDLSRYDASLPLRCVGSVAATFADELRRAAAFASPPRSIASVTARPMAGLINYHNQ